MKPKDEGYCDNHIVIQVGMTGIVVHPYPLIAGQYSSWLLAFKGVTYDESSATSVRSIPLRRGLNGRLRGSERMERLPPRR